MDVGGNVLTLFLAICFIMNSPSFNSIFKTFKLMMNFSLSVFCFFLSLHFSLSLSLSPFLNGTHSINMYVVDGQGRKKRHVVGLAPVSGMCNSLNSCTISEGTSFQTVLVAGHEMGHR